MTAAAQTAELDRATVEAALERFGAPVHLDVQSQRQELMRFGASRVTYQHSEESLLLRVLLIRGGRSAWGTLGSLEPAAVDGLRTRLEELIASLPPSQVPFVPPPSPTRPAMTAYAATERAGAEERVTLLRAAEQALPAGTTLGGSVVHQVVHHAVANSQRLYQQERRTRALFQVVASQGNGSSYGRLLHRDGAALHDPSFLAAMAASLRPLPRVDIETGEHRVVLGPQAMSTILGTYGYVALHAGVYASGDSAVSGRMGLQIASPALTLYDDGCDPAGLPATFDVQGQPKQHVPLLDRGRLVGVVHDSRTAALAGTISTGHAVPTGWRFGGGPSPSHLVLQPGTLSDDDLVQALGEGIYVQRVDYLRVVHPKETWVTGTTRDGTLLVRGGKVVGRTPQFRFTVRLSDVVRDVEALGSRVERGEIVFMESLSTPGALVSRFPVSTVVSR